MQRFRVIATAALACLWLATAGNAQVPPGPGGGSVSVTDGVTTVNPTRTLNFTSGATVTSGGGTTADIAISGGGGGSPGGSTNDIQYKSGASTFGGITLTNGQLVVGQTGSTPLATTISGDATLNAAGALTVSTIGGLTPGTGAFSSPPTSNAIGWDGSQFIVSPSICPTGIETWDGTAAKTIAATTGLLYTTGSTQIAAARVLTLPTVASYVLGCSLTVVDLAGIFNATNLVTPTRASSDTIDGATTGTTLGGAHQSVAYKPTAAGLWATTIAPSIPADTAVSNQFVTAIPATGIITRAQPSCSTLSNGSTGCSTATGTSGATIPLLNGTNTFSGSQTFGEVHGGGRIVTGTTDGPTVADCGTTIHFTSGSAITVTMPNNITALQCTITFIQEGAGQITFAAAAGATIHNRSSFTKTAGQWGVVDMILNTNAGGTSAVYTLAGDGA